MPDIFEFGIIGMGPAGIGMAMSLCGTSSNIKNTICFERGSYPNEKNCSAFLQNECCYSNVCTVISGIGGASTLSSGKISNFPAGSGLVEFFDSEQQLKELFNTVTQTNVVESTDLFANLKENSDEDKSFYTNTSKFEGKDFENDFKEIEEKKVNVFLIIILIAIIISIGIICYIKFFK